MTTTHTPGPWHIRKVVKAEGEQYETHGLTIEGRRGTVCDLFQDHGPNLEHYPKAQQNAALIAAAPGLLTALKDLRTRFHKAAAALGSAPEYVALTTPGADAAIAKAEGSL